MTARLDRLGAERHDACTDELIRVLLLCVGRGVVVRHAQRESQPRIPLTLVGRPERVGVDAVRDEDLHLETGLRKQTYSLVSDAVADGPAWLACRGGRWVDGARPLSCGGCAEAAPARLAVGEE